MIDTLETIVNDNLLGYEVLDAQDILIAAFEHWLRLVENHPALLNSSYQARHLSEQSSQSVKPPVIEPSSMDASTRWKHLAWEWTFRIFEYRDQEKAPSIERSTRPREDWPSIPPSEAASRIAQTAVALSLDDALDLFARVALRWANTCNLEGSDPFDPDPSGPGYHLPYRVDRDAWITQYLLWCFEERFIS